MTFIIHVKTDFQFNTSEMFKSNDASYYLLNIDERDEMNKLIEFDKYSDIVFSNLYTHYTNNSFEQVIQQEFQIQAPVNLVKEKSDLIKYIDFFISNEKDWISRFEKGQVIECPLFFIKSFYSKFNHHNFTILKSQFMKKYIDSIFIVKSEPSKESIQINSFDMFESLFNEHINTFLIDYCIKIYEALKYIHLNNFYGQYTNRYLSRIEENKKIYSKN